MLNSELLIGLIFKATYKSKKVFID